MEQGVPGGHGVLTWPDGRRYEGELQGGEPHGQGVMAWPDGRRYEGEFREGGMHGRGVLTLPHGEGVPGVATLQDGGRMVRLRQRLLLLPERVIATWPDGRRYEGEFRVGGCTVKAS